MSASATSFRRGLILIVFASMMWGTTGLTSKVLNRLSAVDALSVGALRLLTASPVLLLLAQGPAPRRPAPPCPPAAGAGARARQSAAPAQTRVARSADHGGGDGRLQRQFLRRPRAH